jgi:hypothetical protein
MLFLADVAIMPMILATGLLSGVILLVIVTVTEAIILWRLKWGDFKRSLRDAGIANIASTLLGAAFSVIWFSTSFQCPMIPVGGHYEKHCAWTISPLVALVIMWALSVILEGAILLRRKQQPAQRAWRASLIANTVSYVVLLPVYWIAFYEML